MVCPFEFKFPATGFGVDVDSNGRIYLAGWGTNQVHVFEPDGTPAFSFGSSGSGFGQFNLPADVAVDDTDGRIYVADSRNYRWQAFDATGGFLFSVGGTNGPAIGQFFNPQGIAVDENGKVYVTDLENNRVQVFDTSGAFLFQFGTFGSGAGQFYLPNGIEIANNSDIWVTDTFNHRIQVFDSTGAFLFKFGSLGSGPGQMNIPYGIALDPSGRAIVTDLNNDRMLVFNSDGTYLDAFGTTGLADGQFTFVWGVAADADGKVYVTQAANGRVQVFGCPVADSPPIANAGIDFSVDEGQTGVMLDGSASSDPDSDPLAYAWTQLGGTAVTLSDPAAAQPTFSAPLVAIGGETLSFELTVTAKGESDTATVNVTVVNVNHPPVADAGDDQSIAEGSPVTLQGEDSFDIDNDTFTYAWVQTGGTPTVSLSGAGSANPTFTAPIIVAGGAPGVVATLVFELTVDDGFPLDAPAPGYTFANSVDSVTIEVTNLNNDPTAAAGSDQTVDENTFVALDGSASSDPDSDPLTYSWAQIGGTCVVVSGQSTATPSFTVPFVNPGGEDLTFRLTVDDGYGGMATDDVVVHVQNANDPPLVSAAEPSVGNLWPPNHGLVSVSILGVSDPDGNATITIDAVYQDEPTNGQGDGDTAIDAFIQPDGTVLLRAERNGGGNGRVYHIHFTASDLEDSASGVVTVSVNQKKKVAAIDDGELHDSTN